MKSLTLFEQGAKLVPADLDALEKRLGRHLPIEYREFLLNSNGGIPPDDEASVTFSSHSGQIISTTIERFLSVSENAEVSIFHSYTYYTRNARLHDCFIPFAMDIANNLFVLTEDGQVFFWDHELEDANPISPVVSSFQMFLELLKAG